MSGAWWKDASELIQEQIAILDLPLNTSLVIKGPPGSGKTNLLLLRANYMFIADAPNINVVVLGSVLRNFIQLGSDQYKFPPEKVVTHARLFDSLMRESGVPLSTKGMTFADARSARLAAIADLRKKGKIGAVFQGLLLDEAQDYSPDEIELLCDLAETVVATCDVKQKIYEGSDSTETLQKRIPNGFELQYHFRNGRQICRAADEVMRGQPGYVSMTTYSQYDEKEYPSSVTVRKGLDIAGQAAAIASQLADQRVAYPEEVLGVLCPRIEELKAIEAELLKTSLSAEVTNCKEGFDPSRHIWLSTIASAKGLEFRAVHLAGLDHISAAGRSAQRRLAFTGITRAKTALTMYYDEHVPGYLDSAMRVADPLKIAVTKDMIFGKA